MRLFDAIGRLPWPESRTLGRWWPARLQLRVLLLTSAIAVAGIVTVTVFSARAAQQSVDRQFDSDAQAAQAIAGAVLFDVPSVTGVAFAEGAGGVVLDGQLDGVTADLLEAGDLPESERFTARDHNVASVSAGDSAIPTGSLTADALRDRFVTFGVEVAPVVVHELISPQSGAALVPDAVSAARADSDSVTFTSAVPSSGVVPWELAVDERGAVYIGLDERLAETLTDDGSSLLSDVNRNLLITALTAIGMTVGVSFVASRTVTRPVLELTGAARRLEQGDLAQRVSTDGRGEVGELAEAFNSMADSMERQEELRQALVSDVAHELRTPIQNLVGQLDAVADDLLEADDATLESMRDDALLLARLVTDLNELAQAEAGTLRLHPRPVDLVSLLEGVIRSAGPRAEAAGVTLSLDGGADRCELVADRERVAQIAHNLVDNAITNTPRGGAVVVRLTTAADAGFEVVDSGRGIAAEHLPHVFDRFYRVDPSRSRATGGAGLGLAIVHRLVRAHGGAVTVESTPGAGSTFAVTLPRDGAAAG